MLMRMSITLLSHQATCRFISTTVFLQLPQSLVNVVASNNVWRTTSILQFGTNKHPKCRSDPSTNLRNERLFCASSMSGKGLGDLLRVEESVEDVNDRDNDNSSLLAGYEEEEAMRQSTAKGKLEGGLYLVATPIGNLEDMTFRAVRVLKSAEVILAEDTRHSARLLQHYGITTPMMSYHKFNEFARRDATVQRLKLGGILALISDAGMPGISDPGTDLVRACVESNVRVHAVPGASAVITALVASGLPTEEFSFVGFLPTEMTTRMKKLAILSKQTATQIFYVPPHKLRKIVDDCASAFGASSSQSYDKLQCNLELIEVSQPYVGQMALVLTWLGTVACTRRCVLAREMTKYHEEFWRGTLEQAQEEFKERASRGEMTLVIEGLSEDAAQELPSEEDIESELQILLASGVSPSEASRRIVENTGMRRKMVYSLALKLSKK